MKRDDYPFWLCGVLFKNLTMETLIILLIFFGALTLCAWFYDSYKSDQVTQSVLTLFAWMFTITFCVLFWWVTISVLT